MSPTSTLPERTVLDSWLAGQGWEDPEHEPLAGDVGHRRYRRLQRPGPPSLNGQPVAGPAGVESAVLALYPSSLRPASRRFATTTELLAAAGVRVPRVIAADHELGVMLVEYLGRSTLNDWAEGRCWDEILPRFRAALEAARRIAALDPTEVVPLSPPLDAALLARELSLTVENFLGPEGLMEGDDGRRTAAVLEALAATIAEVPSRPCHRDFMVRNLMPLEEGEEAGGVAVLDHQDLRLGPPLYDLASLLNDSLFPPRPIERALVEEWCAGEGEDGGRGVRDDRWLEYHRVAAQRTLKAVGSYAMAAMDGKEFHAHRIGPTFERALDHLSRVPEAAACAADLRRRWQRKQADAMLTS